MADNVTLPGTGSSVASDDIGGSQYQRIKLIYGADGTNSGDVSGTNPLPISFNGSTFFFSTLNTSSAELASQATFTGTIETALNQAAISLLLTSDQPITLTIKQFIDVAGTYAAPNIVYNIAANANFSASFPLNGNYVQVTAKNTGTATTTTFELNTAYGEIAASTSAGNMPISISEINGTAVSGSLPVTVVVPTNGLVTEDANIKKATSSENPLSMFITGSPDSNLAGVNIFEEAFEGNLKMSVATDMQKDSSGSLLIADSAVFQGISTSISIPLVKAFDTTGYNSVNVYVGGGSASFSVQFSENGAFWHTSLASPNGGAFSASANVVTAAAPINIAAPVTGRFCRVILTAYTSGAVFGIARLRSANIGMVNASNILTTQLTNSTGTAYPSEDASIGTMPVLITGGKVRTVINASTFVDGDASMNTFSDSAALIVEKHAVRQLTWSYAAAASGIANTTTAVTIKAAVASQRGNITSIQLQHEPLGAATEFAIRDGAAGTVMWRIKIPLTTAEGPMQFTFDPPLSQAAVNTLIEVVTLTASVTGAVYFNAQGFMSN